MSRTVHVCLSIRGAIRNRSFGGFTNDDGSDATPDQVFNFLCDQLKLGREVIPFVECDNFDYQTGCRGHEVPAEAPGAAYA